MLKKICKTLMIGSLLLFFIGPPPAMAQKKEPIRVGFLACLTGAFAQLGKDMVDGANLYLEETGNQVGGQPIELLIEDTEGVPATSLNKARKLVEMNQVKILTGEVFANAGYALQPYVDSKRMPTLFPVVASDDLTQRKRGKWIVRVAWNASQSTHPFGEYAYQVLGYRKVASIGMDYAFGWELLGGFQRTFEEAGGKIVQKIWCPLTTQDFSPYLPQISKDADAVIALLSGKLSIVFLKQYQDYGLRGKIPLIGGGTLTDESVLPSMGDEALGVITPLHYSPALDNPSNKEFVKKYRAKFGKVPSYYSEACYTGMRWLDQAVLSLKGDVSEPEKVLRALQSVHLKDTPRGPMKIDTYGNPIQNIYIRKVERVGGELQNSVVYTYRDVSQFWKFNPEEFLKLPAYSRDYPPIKP
jgi:branched-chain amino acid transport system substrate-binding protein